MAVASPARVRLSRRELLLAAGAAAVGGVGVELADSLLRPALVNPVIGAQARGPAHVARHFVSRPDLHPATVSVARSVHAPGYLLLAPGAKQGAQAGPMIVDDRGDPVWFAPISGGRWATNFRVQSYRGEPVLTWWEGRTDALGYGHGEGVIVDSAYREVARIRAGEGRSVDMHELVLSPQGTALVTCYPAIVPADLRSIGGPRDGTVLESIIQEIEIASGRVLSEWRSLGHIPVSESHRKPGGAVDYLHVNSIEVLPDGHLLISARHTWALYKLHRRSGEVIWRLGGKRSDFALGARTKFSWQHDARHPRPGTITLFDDASDGPITTGPQSRGLRLEVDERGRTVRLAGAYVRRDRLIASSMGSVQLLSGGNVLVGWGSEPYVSEFATTTSLVADARMASGQRSYRAYRQPWRGAPETTPNTAVRRHRRTRRRTLYVSWNGATAVARWELLVGPGPSSLRRVAAFPRTGFETAIDLRSLTGYAAVAALDASGKRLAVSDPVRT